jgi:diguanylate cyclase (GGDEF)-like protein
VFRTAASAPPVVKGDRACVRLRIGGRTVGVLVLTGTALDKLSPLAAAMVALQLAATLQSLAAERHHQYVTNATDMIRRLFEEGASATSVEEAGQVLANATRDAFHTEKAGIYLIGPDGRINYATSVGPDAEANDGIAQEMIGRIASELPIWQAIQAIGGPQLINDVESGQIRPGGFAEAMGLRSFIAIPLMSAAGPVGMVMCGDSGKTRRWGSRDRSLAQQVEMEGALIVDGARLRQAERRHVAELTRQAYHDALTGLPNRAYLLEEAEKRVEAAAAMNHRLGLLLIDLDGFKAINDTIGHHGGDELLHTVGRRLLNAVRRHDIVARLGGDEFAVLLAQDPDTQAATAIADRIHQRLCEQYHIDGQPVNIGASVGVAMFPSDAGGMAQLLRGADAAMYEAKRAGGGVRHAATR